ncbi:hypothetical protein SAMD00019534_052770, partial [Acytostelium subglobosum LB1]|uniref:hypothetical protein n=1 Tax=Acytostelium subglobosum LB1 TaxID=1410327 RepID=UPI000644DC21
MVLDIIEQLNQLDIVLASGSPRRVEYLRNLGLRFRVVASTFEENLDKSQFNNIVDYAVTNAMYKAQEVFERLKRENKTPNIVIGADSIVVLDNKILEKPKSMEHAKEMLRSLSGRQHQVVSGVHIIVSMDNGVTHNSTSFHESTDVEFDQLSDQSINYYVETCKPLDKAGSYGIQEVPAASFIKRINGCYYNVTGIPIHHISNQLRSLYNQFILPSSLAGAQSSSST